MRKTTKRTPSRVTRKSAQSIAKSSKYSKARKQQIHIVTVVVAAGPFATAKDAKANHVKASKIKNTGVGNITKTKYGYTFPIIQRFAARTQAEKAKLIRDVNSHRVEKGVSASQVKISTKTMAV